MISTIAILVLLDLVLLVAILADFIPFPFPTAGVVENVRVAGFTRQQERPRDEVLGKRAVFAELVKDFPQSSRGGGVDCFGQVGGHCC